jgi:eukaryotic-like serine/threonine-protein kinase
MATLTDTIGRVLSDRYRIEAALGTGASAHVYVATDVTLKRQVAIKMLHPVLAADRAFLRRFRAEAQAAASLSHPNLVGVHDWGEDEDGPYLVLEYLGGGSMRDLLDSANPLQPVHVANIGAQAAHGLAYAHARGFVHRDVKPANLLFADDRRRLCVADFGLARALAEAAWTEPAGATLGTARYAAPEQAQGKRVDGRADVYALALVLYEALTGTVPFSADTTIGTLMARVGADLPAHPALGPLEAVMRAAAAPEPEERLSASELARRLSQVARELPSAGSLPEGKSKTWRPYEELGSPSARPSATAPATPATIAPESTAPSTNGNGAKAGDDPTKLLPTLADNGSNGQALHENADDDIDAMALAEAIGIADGPPRPYVRAATT